MDDFGSGSQDTVGAGGECCHVAGKVVLHALAWVPEKLAAGLSRREV